MINQEVYKWAEWAGEKTGVDPKIIYAQWSLEAGESGIKNPASRNYNLGGLTVAGTEGVWRKFSSVAQYAHDYVYSFILPGYKKALGAQDIHTFASGLKQGEYGSYFGKESVASYENKLASRYAYIFGKSGENLTKNPVHSGQIISEYQTPAWRKIWDSFLDKIGVKNTPEEDIQKDIESQEAQEEWIEEREEGGFWGKIFSFLERFLLVIIGLVVLVLGGFILFYGFNLDKEEEKNV